MAAAIYGGNVTNVAFLGGVVMKLFMCQTCKKNLTGRTCLILGCGTTT